MNSRVITRCRDNTPKMTRKDLSLNNRRKMRKPIESQNKQITSESNKSKVSKQLFLVPALLGGNLLLSAKAAFDAPNTQHWTLNTQHWTLNALNMLKIALTQSDCCTVYIEYTKEVQQYTPKTKFSLFFEHNILTECPG